MLATCMYCILNRLFLYELDRTTALWDHFFSVMTLLLPEVWYLRYLGIVHFGLLEFYKEYMKDIALWARQNDRTTVWDHLMVCVMTLLLIAVWYLQYLYLGTVQFSLHRMLSKKLFVHPPWRLHPPGEQGANEQQCNFCKNLCLLHKMCKPLAHRCLCKQKSQTQ